LHACPRDSFPSRTVNIGDVPFSLPQVPRLREQAEAELGHRPPRQGCEGGSACVQVTPDLGEFTYRLLDSLLSPSRSLTSSQRARSRNTVGRNQRLAVDTSTRTSTGPSRPDSSRGEFFWNGFQVLEVKRFCGGRNWSPIMRLGQRFTTR